MGTKVFYWLLILTMVELHVVSTAQNKILNGKKVDQNLLNKSTPTLQRPDHFWILNDSNAFLVIILKS